MLGVAGCVPSWWPGASGPTPYTVVTHPRMTELPVPADNPITVEGVALGRRLFYDPLLSEDRSLSCASCHQQQHAFSDPRPLSVGVNGAVGRRNAMPLFNLAWSSFFFWDGRSATLEDQVLRPIQSDVEMARDLDALSTDLRANERYQAMFAAAFPGEPIGPDTTAKALAQFVRTIVSFDSPWDATERTYDDAQTRGHQLFFRVIPEIGRAMGLVCNECHQDRPGVRPEWEGHTAGTFAIDDLRNNGLPDPADSGYREVTGKAEDGGRFKVPSIRNLSFTGPYMHDGRFATLEETIAHYNGALAPGADPALLHNGQAVPLRLTPSDLADVVAFFKLFDGKDILTNPAWSDPFKADP
jgi:cytochrome c peroxidase